MARWSIPRRLALCLLLAAPAVAAETPECGLAARRIEIKGELQPPGSKPVLLITVPGPEEPTPWP